MGMPGNGWLRISFGGAEVGAGCQEIVDERDLARRRLTELLVDAVNGAHLGGRQSLFTSAGGSGRLGLVEKLSHVQADVRKPFEMSQHLDKAVIVRGIALDA